MNCGAALGAVRRAGEMAVRIVGDAPRLEAPMLAMRDRMVFVFEAAPRRAPPNAQRMCWSATAIACAR
jgi:hypothetical protein